jgi:hypothetical protein
VTRIPVYEFARRIDFEDMLPEGWELVPDEPPEHSPNGMIRRLRRALTLKDLLLGGGRCPRCRRSALSPMAVWEDGNEQTGYRCAWDDYASRYEKCTWTGTEIEVLYNLVFVYRDFGLTFPLRDMRSND